MYSEAFGGSRRDRRYSDKQFLRSADDMTKLLRYIPEAITNSVEIANAVA